MENRLLYKLMFAAILWAFSAFLFAQEPEEITFDPSKLIPAPNGHYIAGTWLDKSQPPDGILEQYKGCSPEKWSDPSHKESGIQQGFEYMKGMIMRDCWPKDAAATNNDPPIALVSQGYIELTKTKYLGTDSAKMGN